MGGVTHGDTPLIQVRDIDLLRHIHAKADLIKSQPGWSFDPLSVATLDKGRIVSCNFSVAKTPQELDLATQGRFTVNALQWAAGRNVQ